MKVAAPGGAPVVRPTARELLREVTAIEGATVVLEQERHLSPVDDQDPGAIRLHPPAPPAVDEDAAGFGLVPPECEHATGATRIGVQADKRGVHAEVMFEPSVSRGITVEQRARQPGLPL